MGCEIMYPDDSMSLHTDAYELSMAQTYFQEGLANRHAVFEAYFRKMPFKNGYAIYVGLERIIDFINDFHFSKTDIDYLRGEGYSEDFLNYLRDFKFKGTIRSFKEGDLVFNNEPIIQVEGPLLDCQLIETAILNIMNYQTLIATKAAMIKTVVGDDPVLEFGSRRAQELDAAIWGTRASYIGGFDATSNVRAGKIFGIPISGTHAHSLVQTYRNDYDAFMAYAKSHKNCVFLVDTYDTLKSGVPNAIRVAKEMGNKINFLGVRIDSGDMAYVSKRVREMLDEAGFKHAKIYASNDLDEKTIMSLKMQGAKIDVWGIGTKLITAFDQPALGGVYKLVSIENSRGKMVDTLKLTSNATKITTPGKKQVWRINGSEGKSEGDYITLADENPQQQQSLHMFHPDYPYINKDIVNFKARPLLVDIFVDGKQVYKKPSLNEIRQFSQLQKAELWDEYKRTLNPQIYPVDLSEKLWNHKHNLIEEIRSYIDEQL